MTQRQEEEPLAAARKLAAAREGKEVAKFNEMPQNAAEIQPEKAYAEMQDFFTYHSTEESRAVFYDESDIQAGLASVKIWWIKEESGLGYALKSDWKAEKVRWYKLGTEEEWEKFHRGFAAAFRGDNS